jgi:hypothetical protein
MNGFPFCLRMKARRLEGFEYERTGIAANFCRALELLNLSTYQHHELSLINYHVVGNSW